jgi:hypothetical protein
MEANMALKKAKISRWIISILTVIVVSQIIHWIGAAVGMKYYMDPNYFDVWSKLMMPEPGPPPISFMMYSLLFNLITSFIFVFVYLLLYDSIPGTKVLNKGFIYGLIIFIISGVSSALSLTLLMNLPCGLILSWTIEGFIIDITGGMLVAIIVKPIVEQKIA